MLPYLRDVLLLPLCVTPLLLLLLLALMLSPLTWFELSGCKQYLPFKQDARFGFFETSFEALQPESQLNAEKI